jgi:uncharacterized protein YjbJ (UPF0337 family)
VCNVLQASEGGSKRAKQERREDKNEGAMDRAKGRMKEAGGALTGDKSLKREGRSDQRKGRAKEKKGNLKRPTLVIEGHCKGAGATNSSVLLPTSVHQRARKGLLRRSLGSFQAVSTVAPSR